MVSETSDKAGSWGANQGMEQYKILHWNNENQIVDFSNRNHQLVVQQWEKPIARTKFFFNL